MNPANDPRVAGFARDDVKGSAQPRSVSSSAFPVSGYLVVLVALWMIIMTIRLYPQFKDTLREDGRVVGLSDYVEETCGQRIGPDAATCLEEARATGDRLVKREQGRSILLIEAPLLAYLFLLLPLRLLSTRRTLPAGTREGELSI